MYFFKNTKISIYIFHYLTCHHDSWYSKPIILEHLSLKKSSHEISSYAKTQKLLSYTLFTYLEA